jgi:hypothetical protein
VDILKTEALNQKSHITHDSLFNTSCLSYVLTKGFGFTWVLRRSFKNQLKNVKYQYLQHNVKLILYSFEQQSFKKW